MVDDGFATIMEATAYLRISRAKLYGLMESGELTYAKFGKNRRVPWKALRDLAQAALVELPKGRAKP